MKNPCKLLLRFSKCRQAHFEHAGYKTAERMSAISKIQRVASFFSKKSPEVQLRVVNQVRQEILHILPSEHSRFQKLRQNMLDLLDRAQQAKHEPI